MKADETPGGAGDLPGMASPREILNGVNPLVEFRRLKQARSLTPAAATRLASEAAAAILKQHTASGPYLRDAVTLLCEMASLDDSILARIGVHGLFPLLVEPWAMRSRWQPVRSTISSCPGDPILSPATGGRGD